MPINRETETEISILHPLWIRVTGWATMAIGLSAVVVLGLLAVLTVLDELGLFHKRSESDFPVGGWVAVGLGVPAFLVPGWAMAAPVKIRLSFKENQAHFERRLGWGWEPLVRPKSIPKDDVANVYVTSGTREGSTWGVPVTNEVHAAWAILKSGARVKLHESDERKDMERVALWVSERCGFADEQGSASPMKIPDSQLPLC